MQISTSTLEPLISEAQSQLSATDTKASFVLASTVVLFAVTQGEYSYLNWTARGLSIVSLIVSFLCIWPRTKFSAADIGPTSIAMSLDELESRLQSDQFIVGRLEHLKNLARILANKRIYLRAAMLLLSLSMLARVSDLILLAAKDIPHG